MFTWTHGKHAVVVVVGFVLCAPAGAVVLSLLGCGQSAQTASGAGTSSHPGAELTWIGQGGGFMEWGCGGEFLSAKSVYPRVLDVWQWERGALRRLPEVQAKHDGDIVWITGNRYVFESSVEGETRPIGIRDASSGEVRHRWPPPGDWFCRRIQASRRGDLVGLCLEPRSGGSTSSLQIGLIDTNANEIAWITALVGSSAASAGNVRSVIPSDDGQFIAVGGWDFGVAMIDVARKEILWNSRPPNESCLFYVAFSPDSKVIYAGGTSGTVFGLDVQTGAVLSRWYASLSGQEEYGHRISCMAVSPDGRWVAAGTGPEGLVFVGSTQTNKCVKILNHGLSTVQLVHFSPDSQALATFVPGTLKVWNVSQWDMTPPSTAPAQTQAAQTQPAAMQAATSRSGTGRL